MLFLSCLCVQHLVAHFLELCLEFEFRGDGDAVLGDAGSAEARVDDDVTALGAQGHLHRVGKNVDTGENALASIARELYVLGCHCRIPLSKSDKWMRKGSGDNAENVAFLHDQQVFTVNLDFGAGPLDRKSTRLNSSH